ncbi:MAG TPA: carcinine hydrolase/isopenicillin-N N-acyltransferase family protein, partial [Gemmataceae bacterium]|nr:carcinine hydrolase/isopenicillin-N N-acyltransferase family protein [Gemmataceae bacterium]
HLRIGESLAVRLQPGHTFAAGESVRTQFLQLPQVRQTCSVLAAQARGAWGYLHGVNEHGLAVGCSNWNSRVKCSKPGLLGPELVRLVLERAHSAAQALDVLTDLIVRHGQGNFPGNPEEDAADHVFLLADSHEAFAVEAADNAWAAQEIHEVRAVSDVAVIRQDWYRLAPGLAGRAIAEGWWAEDGSKLDFIGALSEAPVGKASALRRWGRATLLLEQQNGHLDAPFIRQLLADHYDGTHFEADPLDGPSLITPLCQHAVHGAIPATAASTVAQLPSTATLPVIVWIALGPPCISVHFPLFLDGELPIAYSGDPSTLWMRTRRLADVLGTETRRWVRVREILGRLQARFEQDVEEFIAEAAPTSDCGRHPQMRRLASSLMQSHVERYEESLQILLGQTRLPAMAGTAVS